MSLFLTYLLLGFVLLGTTVGGVLLVLKGLKELRTAKAKQTSPPTSVYVMLVFGVLLLLPVLLWIVEAIAWTIGASIGVALFQEWF